MTGIVCCICKRRSQGDLCFSHQRCNTRYCSPCLHQQYQKELWSITKKARLLPCKHEIDFMEVLSFLRNTCRKCAKKIGGNFYELKDGRRIDCLCFECQQEKRRFQLNKCEGCNNFIGIAVMRSAIAPESQYNFKSPRCKRCQTAKKLAKDSNKTLNMQVEMKKSEKEKQKQTIKRIVGQCMSCLQQSYCQQIDQNTLVCQQCKLKQSSFYKKRENLVADEVRVDKPKAKYCQSSKLECLVCNKQIRNTNSIGSGQTICRNCQIQRDAKSQKRKIIQNNKNLKKDKSEQTENNQVGKPKKVELKQGKIASVEELENKVKIQNFINQNFKNSVEGKKSKSSLVVTQNNFLKEKQKEQFAGFQAKIPPLEKISKCSQCRMSLYDKDCLQKISKGSAPKKEKYIRRLCISCFFVLQMQQNNKAVKQRKAQSLGKPLQVRNFCQQKEKKQTEAQIKNNIYFQQLVAKNIGHMELTKSDCNLLAEKSKLQKKKGEPNSKKTFISQMLGGSKEMESDFAGEVIRQKQRSGIADPLYLTQKELFLQKGILK